MANRYYPPSVLTVGQYVSTPSGQGELLSLGAEWAAVRILRGNRVLEFPRSEIKATEQFVSRSASNGQRPGTTI